MVIFETQSGILFVSRQNNKLTRCFVCTSSLIIETENIFSFFTGTRIIYDRHFLLQMKNSPLSRTPPVKLATIPDIIDEGVIISNGKSSDLANTSASMKENQNQSELN